MTAPAYVDVVGGLVGWVRSNVAVTRVFTEAPANLADVLPAIKVGPRTGGNDAGLGLDAATVSFSCFAPDLASARLLAAQLQTDLRFNLPGAFLGTGYVTRVTTSTPPVEVPDPNINLRHVSVTVDIYVHSR